MNALLTAILISMLPVFELRGGLTYALLAGINPVLAFFVCVLANILVVFLIFFFLDFLHDIFMKFTFYKRIFGFFHEKAKRKASKVKDNMMSYGYFALMLFVAIPLPVTGAWTGGLIAWILGLDRKKSIASISLGVVIAGIIILTLVLTGVKLFSLF